MFNYNNMTSTLLLAFMIANLVASFKTRLLFEFSGSTFIENIAIRPNGHVLATTFTDAALYTLDPTASNTTARLAAQIPGKTALTGITELSPDTFAVGAGIMANLTFVNGSTSVWVVDFNTLSSEPKVKLGANLPESTIINGLVTLPRHRHMVLAADSIAGAVYRINLVLRTAEIVIQNDILALGADPAYPLGINGIEIHDGYLYLSQSAQNFFARVRISDTGEQTGDFEIIATLPQTLDLVAYDDFAIATNGITYLTAHSNTIFQIMPNGSQTAFYGPNNTPYLSDPTSTALSRDESKLYIVTGGSAIHGGVTGGQIIEVRLD
ncbi:hypothetical protein GGR57DRAFT_452433 [Xylariaceae sp. FL1272]|nr:hypothetical protein GGR57DRAFT_452433 [Xylariaceae sp. FL1272]